jgi:glycosyltransferase involved in cell wall biosynthesis
LAQGVRARLLRNFVNWLYRFALGHPNIRVIFQNPEDRSVLLDKGALNLNQTVLIRGSGVSLEDYPHRPEPVGIPVVVFAARLLRDKGVGEFVEAARLLHSRGVQVRFRLIGSPDPGNPTTITENELNTWRKEGEVELLGFRDDIPELFAEANIVALPSYGEGLPKVLIEAAACGRAVVTTDCPGCRDAIEAGTTGLLVPVRDPIALAEAIEMLIKDNDLRHRMGQAGRVLAELEFGVEKVVDAHLNAYQELLEAGDDSRG